MLSDNAHKDTKKPAKLYPYPRKIRRTAGKVLPHMKDEQLPSQTDVAPQVMTVALSAHRPRLTLGRSEAVPHFSEAHQCKSP